MLYDTVATTYIHICIVYVHMVNGMLHLNPKYLLHQKTVTRSPLGESLEMKQLQMHNCSDVYVLKQARSQGGFDRTPFRSPFANFSSVLYIIFMHAKRPCVNCSNDNGPPARRGIPLVQVYSVH